MSKTPADAESSHAVTPPVVEVKGGRTFVRRSRRRTKEEALAQVGWLRWVSLFNGVMGCLVGVALLTIGLLAGQSGPGLWVIFVLCVLVGLRGITTFLRHRKLSRDLASKPWSN